MSLITTHVLDASLGRPAAGVAVTLQTGDGTTIARGTTDSDGRIADLGPESLPAGHYTLRFAVADYFAKIQTPAFYPVVSIDFTVRSEELHYHVPILLSPFAYSTYRGS